MNSTLNKYEQQIEQAGPDGLDPIARKIMAVGLESIGHDVTIAIESNSDAPINPTKALGDIINKALA